MIILGSKSDRRKNILNFFSIPFTIKNSNFDESLIKKDPCPKKYTSQIALGKAKNFDIKYKNDIILTADTVVFFENKYFEKPQNQIEAVNMLKLLSNNSHEVYTSLCVRRNDEYYVDTEKTTVFFNELTKNHIKCFHDAFFVMDKAGGYSLEENGSIIIKKIDGCFYNVLGLPINTLRKLLFKVGIDLWQYLKK